MDIDRLTKKSRRPVVELMDCLDIYWLTQAQAIPHQWPTRINVASIAFKIPDIARLTCTVATIEAENRIGDVQTIKLRWHFPVTGPQPLLTCPKCGRVQKTLYCHRYTLACRLCHRAVYHCQTCDQVRRPKWKRLKAQARRGIIPAGTAPALYRTLNYHHRAVI